MVDLGANDGYFSLLFDKSKRVTAIDGDANCINELYKILRNDKVENILPLVVDLSAPSPAIGWNNEERDAIGKRLKGDVVLALALVHHLAISNSIPLSLIAGQLQQMGTYLVIEFIPKTDEKVKLLLQNREDVFDEYTLDNFKKCFSRTHNILKEEEVANTGRVLFLMKRI